MLRFVCLLAVISAATAAGLLPDSILPNGRIVGSKETSIENHPYQISLQLDGYHSCGGGLINRNTVVTAAHCVVYLLGKKLSVKVGTSRHADDNALVIPVKDVVQHERYWDAESSGYDIAVLRLEFPVPGYNTKVRSIRLATSEPAAGSEAILTGWGTSRSDKIVWPTVIREVTVPLVSREDCSTKYSKKITETMICFGDGGKNACQGDSGGPLVYNNELLGIVSWGCNVPDYPHVYTSVPNLLSWIHKAVAALDARQ